MEYAHKRVAIQLDFLQRVANMAVQVVGAKGTLYADLIKEEIQIVSPESPKGKLWACDKLPNGNDIYLRQFDFFFAKALPGYRPVYPGTAGFASWADVENAADVLQLVDIARRASDTGTRQIVPPVKAKAA
jgi:hypothetical protein